MIEKSPTSAPVVFSERSRRTRKPLSQRDLIIKRFNRHRVARVCLWVLGGFLLLAVFAEFLVPNAPTRQFRGQAHVPPRVVHFWDDAGRFHLQPFIYGYEEALDMETFQRTWAEIKDERYPIRLFARGFEYRLLGLIPTDVHLFGVGEEAPLLALFGTDNLGRDVFSRTVYATRTSLSIAILGVAISILLGILIGGVAGYYGGVMDEVVQRLSEVVLSVPTLPLWMGLAAAIPANWPITRVYVALVVIISFISWPGMARGIRSKLISLRQEDYVRAAISYAASDARIIFRHLVPNFASYIIVSVTLAIPGMILTETALSFLGLGLRSPAVSWGVQLQQAQNFQTVLLYPWLLIPGLFVVLCILALNFVGDGLRDATDPFEKG
jgi:peptide/nickel transport system permease protein